MKEVTMSIRKNVMAIMMLATVSVLFTACLKDNDDVPEVPTAGLMAFNLVPDQPAVTIRLSNNILGNSALNYTNYTGSYYPIYTGTRTVEALDYGAGRALTSSTYNFEQDKYYSLFVLGFNNSYRNVITVDNFDSLSSSGSAYIRYINAIVDSVNASNVTISSNGNNVVNESAAFGAVSAFKAVNAGAVNVVAKNSQGVDVNRSITLDQKKVYTVLLTGVPGATDDVKKVQIKYIANGTLTDSTGK